MQYQYGLHGHHHTPCAMRHAPRCSALLCCCLMLMALWRCLESFLSEIVQNRELMQLTLGLVCAALRCAVLCCAVLHPHSPAVVCYALAEPAASSARNAFN